MARPTREAAGSWLEGPAFDRTSPRGVSLGLPAEGPGSLASPGVRLVAFLIDGVVANLLAGLPYLFGVRYGPGERGYVVYAAFLLAEFVLVSVAGATIGKQLCRIRVIRLDGGRLAWPWVLARTILLGFLIPAIIWDRDGRGLHDKASGALTIRTGGAPPPPSAATPPPATQQSPRRAPAKSSPKRRKKRR
jgi:uncharacterized RDD family membrane protein YckC